MLFNSLEFLLLFLPFIFIVFFILARIDVWGHKIASAWLTAASIFFYGWWDPRNVVLLCCSILFNFFMGRIQAKNSQRPAWLLSLSVGGNLALLCVYKYAGLAVSTYNTLSGSNFPVPVTDIPLGISFFTFTQIAFQVDVHRKLVNEYNFIHYALFVTYFPHLLAGPILHHKQMMPQFEQAKTYRMSADNCAVGLSLFIGGLAKKMLLADRLSAYANPVFLAASNGAPPSFFVAWTGALAFTFQIYFDFSGYSDMAIGLSRLFGIDLPLNFNSPYKSKNIIEFWRRWHMSLSTFLKDYLYIPLGGNRLGVARRYVNLMVTMLLGGMWHGANWTFLAWGGLHGLYLCINHVWHTIAGHSTVEKLNQSLLVRIASTIATFFAVVVAWVFFKAESFIGALAILRGMSTLPDNFKNIFASNETLARLGFEQLFYLLLVSVVVTWGFPNTQQIFLNHPAKHLRRYLWRPTPAWALIFGALLAFCIMDMQHVTEFLYFRF